MNILNVTNGKCDVYFTSIKIKLTVQVCIIAVSAVEKVFRELSGHRTGRLALVWGSGMLLRGTPITTPQSRVPQWRLGRGQGPAERALVSAVNLPHSSDHNAQ